MVRIVTGAIRRAPEWSRMASLGLADPVRRKRPVATQILYSLQRRIRTRDPQKSPAPSSSGISFLYRSTVVC